MPIKITVDPSLIQQPTPFQNITYSQQPTAPVTGVAGSEDLDSLRWYDRLGKGALSDINELATGLAGSPRMIGDYVKGMFTDPEYRAQQLKKAFYTQPVPMWTYTLLHNGQAPESFLRDMGNATLSTYGLDEDTIRSGKASVRNTLNSIIDNPLWAGVDVLSMGGGSAIGKTVGSAAKAGKLGPVAQNLVRRAEVAGDVTRAKNAAEAEMSPAKMKVYNAYKEADKGLTDKEKALVRQSAEENTQLTDPKLIEAKKKLKEGQIAEQELVPDYAKEDPKELSVTQYVARKNNITVQQARKEIEKRRAIGATTAETGKVDKISKDIADAEKAFDNGDIFPVSHAMQSADELAKGMIEDGGRTFAGRYSSREFGLTPYETIVKNAVHPANLAEGRAREAVQATVAREVAENGTLAGKSVAPVSAKDTVYVSKEKLTNGSLKDALNSTIDYNTAQNVKNISETHVPVSKAYVKEIKDQFGLNTSKGKGILGDFEYIFKQSMLAAGGYVGGNILTGAVNNLMNSGIHTGADFMAALRSKGALRDSLGLTRVDAPKVFNTGSPLADKAFHYLDLANKYSGGALWRQLDKIAQNFWAEMASHAELRKMGITNPEARVKALAQMSPQTLGEAIENIRHTALLNPSKTILPRGVTDILSAISPFWRWSDTALQSSVNMFARNPIAANLIAKDYLAKLSFDKEMQNRENLGVISDKPAVIYRLDPNTGKIMESTNEFMPVINSLKLGYGLLKGAQTGKPSDVIDNLNIAGWGDIIAAAKGQDRYGNPLKNPKFKPYQGKRYHIGPNGIEEIDGGTWGEIGAAAATQFIGGINTINKTAVPATVGLYNAVVPEEMERNWYLPSSDSIFGATAIRGEMPDTPRANPMKPRSGQDVLRSFTGAYEHEYYPERQMTPMQQVRLIRGLSRANMRMQPRLYEKLNERE